MFLCHRTRGGGTAPPQRVRHLRQQQRRVQHQQPLPQPQRHPRPHRRPIHLSSQGCLLRRRRARSEKLQPIAVALKGDRSYPPPLKLRRTSRLWLQLVGSFRFRRIHFIDFTVQGAAADAEFFGCGGHVAICRCERLSNQSRISNVLGSRAPCQKRNTSTWLVAGSWR